MQRPAQPSGDPSEFGQRRANAYRELFGGGPIRIIPHDLFEKPPFGGRVDVHVYGFRHEGADEQIQVAVTSGMSDYRMIHAGDRLPRRRELVQYFRQCRSADAVRLHDLAWLPIAQRFCLDFFETVGPHPAYEKSWPNALFIPSLVQLHAAFKLDLGGDEMRFLWHVPLSQGELDFKMVNGLDALLGRMQERELPWVFEESTRVALV